jgi:hypothetical protein
MVSKIKSFSSSTVLACLAFSVNAESLNIEKYQQAERQLGKYTEKLVVGTVEYPSWTENNKLIYNSQTQHGKQFFIFDAVTKKKKLAFDHQKISRALARLTEQEIKPENLPFNRFELISEKVISLTIDDKLYQCNIENYLCRLSAFAIKDSELVSPNGKLAVYIKEHNLWLRNLDNNSEKN